MTSPTVSADTTCSSPSGGLVISRRPNAPVYYELRVEGHLDEHWSTWFDGMALVHQDDGTTTLRGLVADQAALHGHLAKVRDLATPLISVKIIDAPP
jgi:hypothetical protein